MFVDASAIVAILVQEEGYETLSDHLEASAGSITSGLAIFEATLAVSRILVVPPDDAGAAIDAFLYQAGIALVPITAPESRMALVAHARYGKGRGHPARLNLGDCFAYACARVHEVPLLFVGDDFPHTDIRSGLA